MNLATVRERTQFQQGNTFSLVHGAYSQAAITPVAELVAAVAVERAPVLQGHAFLVDLFSQEYAVVLLLRKALDTQGVVDHAGAPRGELLKNVLSHSRLALQLLREAGLTRKVAAELQLEIAQTAQAVMSAERIAATMPAPVEGWLQANGLGVALDGELVADDGAEQQS